MTQRKRRGKGRWRTLVSPSAANPESIPELLTPWSLLKCYALTESWQLDGFAFQLDKISQSSQDESSNRIDPYLLKILELLILLSIPGPSMFPCSKNSILSRHMARDKPRAQYAASYCSLLSHCWFLASLARLSLCLR